MIVGYVFWEGRIYWYCLCLDNYGHFSVTASVWTMSHLHLRSSTTQKLVHWLRKHPICSVDASRNFTVLGLESSADDTCVAVVTSSRDILSNVVLKQLDLCVKLYSTTLLEKC
jgi:hypothetical protein